MRKRACYRKPTSMKHCKIRYEINFFKKRIDTGNLPRHCRNCQKTLQVKVCFLHVFSLRFGIKNHPKIAPKSIKKLLKHRFRNKASHKTFLEGSWASLGLSRAPFETFLGEFLGSKMGHKREQKGTEKGYCVRRGLWTASGTPLGRFWSPYGRLLGASGLLWGICRGLQRGILPVLVRIFGFPAPSPNFLVTFSPLSKLSPYFVPTFFCTFSELSPDFLLTFFQLSPHILPTFSPCPPHFLPTISPLSPKTSFSALVLQLWFFAFLVATPRILRPRPEFQRASRSQLWQVYVRGFFRVFFSSLFSLRFWIALSLFSDRFLEFFLDFASQKPPPKRVKTTSRNVRKLIWKNAMFLKLFWMLF